MEVPFPHFRDIGPGRAPEIAFPVIGRALIVVLPFPPVIVAVIGGILVFRGLEPSVLVACVVHHEVHDDADPPLLRLEDEAIHILHRPVFGIDGVVVGNVVAEIPIRGLIDGRKP